MNTDQYHLVIRIQASQASAPDRSGGQGTSPLTKGELYEMLRLWPLITGLLSG
jgi:hypothetical protein